MNNKEGEYGRKWVFGIPRRGTILDVGPIVTPKEQEEANKKFQQEQDRINEIRIELQAKRDRAFGTNTQ